MTEPEKGMKGAEQEDDPGRENTLVETIKTVVYAVLIALVIRTFAFEPFNIPSGSMIPNLLVGDYLFVSKYAYGYSQYSAGLGGFDIIDGRLFYREPERGDIAVFKLPRDNRSDYIKRIVAVAGDRVQVTDGILYLNGEAVERERVADYEFVERSGRSRMVPRYIETLPNGRRYAVLDDRGNAALDNTELFTVPPGHVFAMGDNRDNSLDSRAMREVGFIPVENLVGRAEIIFFSIDSAAAGRNLWDGPFGLRLGRFFDLLGSRSDPAPGEDV